MSEEEKDREKERAEISKRSLEAHAELAKFQPSPTNEEIDAFRQGKTVEQLRDERAAKKERAMQAKPAVTGYETRDMEVGGVAGPVGSPTPTPPPSRRHRRDEKVE